MRHMYMFASLLTIVPLPVPWQLLCWGQMSAFSLPPRVFAAAVCPFVELVADLADEKAPYAQYTTEEPLGSRHTSALHERS